jgi:predicted DsbA family dithiol-disulfide isomerase
MNVEVWSDVVCPWCYLGKRRLEAALAELPERDQVTVIWRSFELDPAAPRRRAESAAEHLAAKYGMTPEQVAASWERLTALAEAEGLEYRLASTQGGSSFDAHRLAKLGGEPMVERLFRAYFTEGLPIGEPETLAELGRELGLPADEVDDLLAGDRFADEVRADEQRAAQLGIGGVPFFAIDERYGVSGAQSVEVLKEALATALTGV